MFGLISKKRVKEELEILRAGNRASNLGQSYKEPISEKQKEKNLYAQGYEDGTDNMYNTLSYRLKL